MEETLSSTKEMEKDEQKTSSEEPNAELDSSTMEVDVSQKNEEMDKSSKIQEEKQSTQSTIKNDEEKESIKTNKKTESINVENISYRKKSSIPTKNAWEDVQEGLHLHGVQFDFEDWQEEVLKHLPDEWFVSLYLSQVPEHFIRHITCDLLHLGNHYLIDNEDGSKVLTRSSYSYSPFWNYWNKWKYRVMHSLKSVGMIPDQDYKDQWCNVGNVELHHIIHKSKGQQGWLNENNVEFFWHW